MIEESRFCQLFQLFARNVFGSILILPDQLLDVFALGGRRVTKMEGEAQTFLAFVTNVKKIRRDEGLPEVINVPSLPVHIDRFQELADPRGHLSFAKEVRSSVFRALDVLLDRLGGFLVKI